MRAVVASISTPVRLDLAGERFRHEGEEEAGPASGLEDRGRRKSPCAGRARQMARTMNSGRVMGILRGAGEARELVARDEPLQLLAEILPALGEGLAGAAEHHIGEVARAEADEAAQDAPARPASRCASRPRSRGRAGWRRDCRRRGPSSRGRAGGRRAARSPAREWRAALRRPALRPLRGDRSTGENFRRRASSRRRGWSSRREKASADCCPWPWREILSASTKKPGARGAAGHGQSDE